MVAWTVAGMSEYQSIFQIQPFLKPNLEGYVLCRVGNIAVKIHMA